MRIVKINEQQYHSLLMNEEMHYPKFLDKLQEEKNNITSIFYEKYLVKD